jgi:hypothetical protein
MAFAPFIAQQDTRMAKPISRNAIWSRLELFFD